MVLAFQTSLSEAFNAKNPDRPIGAGRTKDNRLFFAPIDSDGNLIPSPTVEHTSSATSPTASGSLINTVGLGSPTPTPPSPEPISTGFAAKETEGGAGGTGPEAQAPAPPNTGNLTAMQGFVNALGFTNPLGAIVGVAQAIRGKKDLSIAGLGKELAGLGTPTGVQPDPPDVRGFTRSTQQQGPGNTRSIAGLNSMSGLGTVGPTEAPGLGPSSGPEGGPGGGESPGDAGGAGASAGGAPGGDAGAAGEGPGSGAAGGPGSL